MARSIAIVILLLTLAASSAIAGEVILVRNGPEGSGDCTIPGANCLVEFSELSAGKEPGWVGLGGSGDGKKRVFRDAKYEYFRSVSRDSYGPIDYYRDSNGWWEAYGTGFKRNREHEYVVHFVGEVRTLDSVKLRSRLRQVKFDGLGPLNESSSESGFQRTLYFTIDSPGGSYLEGQRMVAALREWADQNRVFVYTIAVGEGASSAAAGLWLAGDCKMIANGSQVGFHAPYHKDDLSKAERLVPELKASITDAFRQNGEDATFIAQSICDYLDVVFAESGPNATLSIRDDGMLDIVEDTELSRGKLLAERDEWSQDLALFAQMTLVMSSLTDGEASFEPLVKRLKDLNGRCRWVLGASTNRFVFWPNGKPHEPQGIHPYVPYHYALLFDVKGDVVSPLKEYLEATERKWHSALRSRIEGAPDPRCSYGDWKKESR